MASPNELEIGGSGFSHYSAISTLERQYAHTGHRIFLFLKTNANVCVDVETILKLSKTALVQLSSDQTMATTNGTLSDDPFYFLSESDPVSLTESSVASAASSSTNRGSVGGFLGKSIAKIAKNTSKTLERGMHSLAIKADQGRNPDLFVVGIYDGTKLLHMTESESLEETGISFVIPLVVPPTSNSLSIKLWIRSGAALLQQTKQAKNFLVGSATLNVNNLRKQLQARQPLFLQMPLQSIVVAGGILFVCATLDTKFPQLSGRGWSLADPVPGAYQPPSLYNFPLDQPYAFDFPPKSSAYLIATERSIESTVVLPIATAVAQMAARACKISLDHAESMASRIYAGQIDAAVGEYIDVNVNIAQLQVDPVFLKGAQPLVAAAWQRPDSIFEVELVKPSALPVSFRFFPKPCRDSVLPSLLQANSGRLPTTGFMLGNLSLPIVLRRTKSSNAIAAANPFDPVGASIAHQAMEEEVWECVIGLEALMHRRQDPSEVLQFPVFDSSCRQLGLLRMTVTMERKQGPAVPFQASPSRGGLVSLMGLAPCQSVQPPIDYDFLGPSPDPNEQVRNSQVATMGLFVTHAYLQNHIKFIREMDYQLLVERSAQYKAALNQRGSSDKQPPNEDRSPRAFRPSSSRPEVVLSGIPFNVHTASLSLNVMDPDERSEPIGSSFYNTTCGAPSDHARGFGNIFATKESDSTVSGTKSPVGSVSGGLRRLELKRQEISELVTSLQTKMISSIVAYFAAERQSGKPLATHVSARNAELQHLKSKMCEAVQSLHHATWVCSARRCGVFSQTLGIAVTTYLASLSDPEKCQSTWPERWARHGYLLSFEGLLSAAGKELGMIEDAIAGIAMLRMVQVVLVRDNGGISPTQLPIPGSSYLKWMELVTSGEGALRQFTLEIGIVPSYYDQRIPPPLRNGRQVRLYTILFEVGVDVRQWGANAGSNVRNQWQDRSMATSWHERGSEPPAAAPAGLLDDEDDDVGVRDDDVLVQLNYEAFRLLNSYAHLVSPTSVSAPDAAQKTHPMLERLHQHIVESSGKMNHSILDEAATLAQQLGGGGAVFCKSGKDRTAMHVTFKQAQFVHRYRASYPAHDGTQVVDETLEYATLMRVYGTRLPICEKNVGESKYAFNSLQVRFMPETLRPPLHTLAGFLKGGKVFTGGAIES